LTAYREWKPPKLEEKIKQTKSEEADQEIDDATSIRNRKFERQLKRLYASLEVFNRSLKGRNF
jgi:hypothetical protein